MEKYRTELGDFEQHTSAEVLKNIQFAIAQPDSVAIFAILPQHNLNQFAVSDIRLLKHKIAEKADLEQAAVSTYMIVESSVKIIFSNSKCTCTRTVTPPALQKSGSRSHMRQMRPSVSLLSSSASECSRLAEDGLPVIACSQVKVHQHKVIMNGDSAVICKAQFLSLSCAAKYIHPELSKCSKWQVEDFERGCKLLQNIRHPNIVLPFGICYDESVVGPILIMELMDLNLKDFLEKSHQSPLPLHSQLDLCSDVAQGLEYLHSNNIIHSNLNATNVLVKGGRAKIGGVTSLQVNAPEAELSVGSGAAVGLPRKSFSSGILQRRH
ncbi:Tyrosine-protein kinase FRK [Geodia barretti]|uniref:Tyrosine-protein kinase FRK n=1 Tax=Geodia barretti TaxID=519541 RepID=A0AA35TS50_GEOBA|nr:Tyrosine-protein kinase FRK [Geodia barretti]